GKVMRRSRLSFRAPSPMRKFAPLCLRKGFSSTAIVLLLCWCGDSYSQNDVWQKYNRDGIIAFKDAHYIEAETQFRAAIEEAQKLGDDNLRLAESTNNLCLLYHALARYVEAEQLGYKALRI